jgi:hypothetical protein
MIFHNNYYLENNLIFFSTTFSNSSFTQSNNLYGAYSSGLFFIFSFNLFEYAYLSSAFILILATHKDITFFIISSSTKEPQ